MWQKQQQVGSYMACAPFVNLIEWKIWKRSKRVCWMKITIIYNLGNVYQTKDIQPRSESLKSVQVWVIEKSHNCPLAHCSCKNAADNFDHPARDVVTVKIIFDKNSISVPWACCGCLGVSSSWMRGAECWPVSESETENILASDSSSESPMVPNPWWFFVASMFIFEILQPYCWMFSFRSLWAFRCYWDGIVRNFLYFFCRQLTQFVFFLIHYFDDETWLRRKTVWHLLH